jgi:hypothetical protein
MGHVAALWVFDDQADPRRGLVKEASLAIAGKQAADLPVCITPGRYGRNIADAILKAAEWVNQCPEGEYGQLSRLVRDVYPRPADGVSHPSDLALALMVVDSTAAIAGSDAGRVLVQGNARRSEFLRRLHARELKQAWDKVRVRPLCKWLLDALPGFEYWRLATQIEIEFLRTFSRAEPADPKNAGDGGSAAAEDWQPASRAVAIACQKGYKITADWISKRKDRLRTRGPQLPGRHKLEVEMNSLATVLFAENKRGAPADTDTDEPDESERKMIEARMEQERQRKRRALN